MKNSEFDLSNKNILLIGCNGVLGQVMHKWQCKNLILAFKFYQSKRHLLQTHFSI